MTILIVEDNKPMRILIKNMVGDLTDDIYECDDGDQAFDAYSSHHPDWVLMDIRMKRTDGLTATRRIKAEFPDARILIVTGHDDPRLREAARDAGACGFVNKENLIELRDALDPDRCGRRKDSHNFGRWSEDT